MVKTKNKKVKPKELKLHQKLILNRYFLNMLSVESIEQIPQNIKLLEYEGINEENSSNFYEYFNSVYKNKCKIPKEKLTEYDENIVKYTRNISEKRDSKIQLKYFQYISILFTEIFLDKYFTDKEAFLLELNAYIDVFNKDKDAVDKILYYSLDDLNKLAFWNATGSGKTLIMHINILQYMHYISKNGKANELNKIILLTPNEGLSMQHIEELKLSNINAVLFDKNLNSSQSSIYDISVEVIDINKIRDEQGDKTVAVECFESNNLVLVDEGHRGSSGEEWKAKRDALSKSGFTFEYSATFGQAIQSSKKDNLIQEYSKCIIFDYSYRYFYRDGFGKDYNILNLESKEDKAKELYMTAALLSFYQQKKLYIDKTKEFKVYNLENPLFIFVGSSVNAVRTENKTTVSDVIDIILFLSEFVKNIDESTNNIAKLIRGNSELIDSNGREIFKDSFKYLVKLNMNEHEIYKDIIEQVFNCSYLGADIHLDNLKGATGEIGIRLAGNEYFGIINVGDDSKLLKLCEDKGINTAQMEFKGSLFKTISRNDSNINILIGSKKFTEGWNSYRVSTMGLMNIGRTEGAEVIQLFGRGVRLKGRDYTLKRSSYLKDEGVLSNTPEYIEIIETLNIFGVKADYMNKFKEFLDKEDIKTNNKSITIEVPIKKLIVGIENEKLKTIKIREGLNFKANCRPVFSLINNGNISNKIKVDMYPIIKFKTSSKISNIAITKNVGNFSKKNLTFINMDEIYFEMIKYKNEKGFYNINISKEELLNIIENKNWYELRIPQDELELKDFRDFIKWQNIIIILLKKYMDFFYKYKRAEYEAPHMYYDIVRDEDSNFENIDKYVITINNSFDNDSIKSVITRLKQEVSTGKLEEVNWESLKYGKFEPIYFNRHLYNPLLFIEGKESEVKITPQVLNEGEKKLVADIKRYYETKSKEFENKKLYFLRNKSKSGIGFFEANNFYPDFILWIVEGNNQIINFIDPKGIRNIKDRFDNPKLKLHQVIKEIEERLDDSDIKLNSFIIANTKYSDVSDWGTKDEFIDNNILFQEDDNYIDSMFNNINIQTNIIIKEITEINLV